jgi:hypothetical protein
LLLLALLLSGSGAAQAQSPDVVTVGAFSAEQPGARLPENWQPLTFRSSERHTDYSLVDEAGTVVVKAVSERAASGLTRTLSIDPARYPVVAWRWKVTSALPKSDATRKDGDDFAARLYISFAMDPDKVGYLERLKQKTARLLYGPDVPYRALTYIWGNHSAAGAMTVNPYTDRVMMVAVQSGDSRAGRWVSERRNVYEDYQKAFGEAPPMISGVAIMTDTDNTVDSAVAWYGDIAFERPGSGPAQ